MYIYVCVCICVHICCMCVCVCMFVCMCVCVCIYIYICIYVYVYMYMYICICRYVCIGIYVYVCIRICVCVCVCICIYVYLYIIFVLHIYNACQRTADVADTSMINTPLENSFDTNNKSAFNTVSSFCVSFFFLAVLGVTGDYSRWLAEMVRVRIFAASSQRRLFFCFYTS
jgi:hypothetical protein